MTRDWMLTALAVAAPYLAAGIVAAATLLVNAGLAWAAGGGRAVAIRRDAALGAAADD